MSLNLKFPTLAELQAKRTINPIKAELVTYLNLFAKPIDEGGLGLVTVRSIKNDISPQDIVEALKEESPRFPSIIVNYAGRIPTREGANLVTDPTFALFVADRDLTGPFVSGSSAIDLIEDLVNLIDDRRFSTLQRDVFKFAGDQIMYQDATLVIYQLLFRTTTVHQRRF